MAGVYPTIPRMNHSCAPSVVWSYARADLMAKEVRALRDIQPGEELCPNYIDSFEVRTIAAALSRHRKYLSIKMLFCQEYIFFLQREKKPAAAPLEV